MANPKRLSAGSSGRRSCDQRPISEATIRASDQCVHPSPLGNLAPIVAPRHLIHIARKVLGAHPVVDADDLALQQSPDAFNGVGVSVVVADIFARAVVHRVVVIVTVQAAIAASLVGIDVRPRRDVGADGVLQGFSLRVLDGPGAKFTIALDDPHDNCLSDAAAPFVKALGRMLVRLLAADERLVGLDGARQRRVERLGGRCVPQAVKHEPCRLLGDLDIACELGAGDALLVRGDQPDRHEPLAERDFAILKDGPDLDRETLAAIAALVGLLVTEVIDFGRATMRAERAILPANSREVRDGRRFIGDRVHQLEEAVKFRHVACSIEQANTISPARLGQASI